MLHLAWIASFGRPGYLSKRETLTRPGLRPLVDSEVAKKEALHTHPRRMNRVPCPKTVPLNSVFFLRAGAIWYRRGSRLRPALKGKGVDDSNDEVAGTGHSVEHTLRCQGPCSNHQRRKLQQFCGTDCSK